MESEWFAEYLNGVSGVGVLGNNGAQFVRTKMRGAKRSGHPARLCLHLERYTKEFKSLATLLYFRLDDVTADSLGRSMKRNVGRVHVCR